MLKAFFKTRSIHARILLVQMSSSSSSTSSQGAPSSGLVEESIEDSIPESSSTKSKGTKKKETKKKASTHGSSSKKTTFITGSIDDSGSSSNGCSISPCDADCGQMYLQKPQFNIFKICQELIDMQLQRTKCCQGFKLEHS